MKFRLSHKRAAVLVLALTVLGLSAGPGTLGRVAKPEWLVAPAMRATPSAGRTRDVPNPGGRHLYVASQGNDGNRGSAEAPFRTIQRASEAATPGTVVHVAPGMYREVVRSRTNGTAQAPIRFLADGLPGAVIRPSGAIGAIWRSDGDHVTIQGFEIDGTDSPASRTGLYLTGGHSFAIGNFVHHILRSGSSDAQGGGGIVLGGSYFNKADQHAIGNRVASIGTATSERINAIYHQSTGSVVNNVVHDNPGSIGIALWHDVRDVTIANNTVYRNSYGIAIGSGDYYAAPAPADHIRVINNIVYENSAYGVGEMGWTGPENVVSNNLVVRNGIDWHMQNGGRHSGDVNADPEFVNPKVNDVRLGPRSPAIDAGTLTGAPATDIEGLPRLGPPDLGAFEWRPENERIEGQDGRRSRS